MDAASKDLSSSRYRCCFNSSCKCSLVYVTERQFWFHTVLPVWLDWSTYSLKINLFRWINFKFGICCRRFWCNQLGVQTNWGMNDINDTENGFIPVWKLRRQNIEIFTSYHEFCDTNVVYRVWILPYFTGLTSSISIHNSDSNYNAVVDFVSDHLLVTVQGGQSSMQAMTPKKQKVLKNWIQEWMGTTAKTLPR